MTKLRDRVAIITGSGRGIGKAIARKLAAEGAAVVVNDLDEAPAFETVEEITAAGGSAIAIPGSVTEPEFADRILSAAIDTYGALHIIVNNAGFTWDNVIQKMSDEKWDALIDVHLKAPFWLLRAAQPIFSAAAKAERANGGEAICRKVVNVSSISGFGGSVGQSNYSAAKAGVIGLTKSLAKEWGRYNVTVNAVAFGIIRTRLSEPTETNDSIDIDGKTVEVGMSHDAWEQWKSAIPLGRTGTPEDAAGAVYLLCLPESNYVTGEVLICSGGYVY